MSSQSPRPQTNFVALNNLSPAPCSTKNRKRVGRGIGSGTGKTAGRGHKGTRSRAGGSVRIGFEGGQTPIYRRMPKIGFTNAAHTVEFERLNLGKLQNWIDMGRLSTGDEAQPPKMITMRDLLESGLFTKVKQGVKLLGGQHYSLRTPLHIEVSSASPSAIEAIERAGGTVTTAHYNRLALRALLKPDKFEAALFPRRARPPPRLMPQYLDWDRRGEFNPDVQLRNKRLGLVKDVRGPTAPSPLKGLRADLDDELE